MRQPSRSAPTEAEAEVRRRVQQRGPITFAEFMEVALFWPRGGYYTSLDRIGPEGDFYTAPGAHPAFGALLCLQLYQMWRLLGEPRPFTVVELGAGGGLLCHDILAASVHLPPAFGQALSPDQSGDSGQALRPSSGQALHYLCLDRVPRHGHEAGLEKALRQRVARLAAEGVPLRGVTGCILSNELVDSFPVHVVEQQDGGLREVYVTLEGGRLVEMLEEPSTPELERRLRAVGVSLPPGYRAEVNLALEEWVAQVAAALQRGFVLTIDYGDHAQGLYAPHRRRGTLTCYYEHTQTDNPYQRIGRQDMSAFVDFTSLVEAGRHHGLEPAGFTTQRSFLTSLGLQRLVRRLALPQEGLSQPQQDANRMGMLDIARPGGLGEFRVLAQAKGVESTALWGFREEGAPMDETLAGLLEALPVPLLTPRHMPLLEGRYPHLAWQQGVY